jgi:hypothetical protein
MLTELLDFLDSNQDAVRSGALQGLMQFSGSSDAEQVLQAGDYEERLASSLAKCFILVSFFVILLLLLLLLFV